MFIFFWEIFTAILAYVQPALLDKIFRASHILAIATITLSIVLSLIGSINAQHPKTRRLEYSFPRGTGVSTSFRIVAASDIHLGTIIGKKRFDRLVTQINSLNPDLVFFV